MIDCFKGEYRWLSNFAPVYVVYDGVRYKSVEHAYQASKFSDISIRLKIQALNSPGDAKRIARNFIFDSDFDDRKYEIMKGLLWQKFNKEPYKSKLIKTDDQEIIEGNWWGDTYWGVCKGIGENNLGKLIMKIREYLVNG